MQSPLTASSLQQLRYGQARRQLLLKVAELLAVAGEETEWVAATVEAVDEALESNLPDTGVVVADLGFLGILAGPLADLVAMMGRHVDDGEVDQLAAQVREQLGQVDPSACIPERFPSGKT